VVFEFTLVWMQETGPGRLAGAKGVSTQKFIDARGRRHSSAAPLREIAAVRCCAEQVRCSAAVVHCNAAAMYCTVAVAAH